MRLLRGALETDRWEGQCPACNYYDKSDSGGTGVVLYLFAIVIH
jgi:hypothetical protein